MTLKGEKREANYRVHLLTTRPQFGGVRWWFVCPLIINGRACSRRAGKLYLPPGGVYFGCRKCHRLTYTSCRESRKYDGLIRYLARDLGTDFRTARKALNSLGRREV